MSISKLRLGIIGDMGPEADEFFQKRVRQEMIKRGATKDQHHLPMVVIKNPNIPDRTSAILENGINPLPELLNVIKDLEKLSIFFAVMTCNTAHYFRKALQEKTDIYLVDMLKATSDVIKENKPTAKVALLATNGTIESKIYDAYLTQANIHFIKPSPDQQEYVHSAIYGTKTETGRQNNGLKAGEYTKNAQILTDVIKEIQEKEKIDSVILGCTELPLVEDRLKEALPHISFVDPMACVAQKIVDIYEGVKEKLETDSLGDIFYQKVIDINTTEEAIDYVYHRVKA